MTRYESTFEGGTNGAAVTTSSPGTALDVVSPGVVYDTAVKRRGSASARLNLAAGSACVLAKGAAHAPLNADEVAARVYMRLSGLPGTDNVILRMATATGGWVLRGHILGSGRLALRDSTGATLWTSTDPITAAVGEWMRLEARAKIGGAGVGEAHLAAYLGDDTVPFAAGSSTTTANMGGAQIGTVAVGKYYASEAWADAIHIDDFAVETTPNGALIGPALDAPLVNATTHPTGTVVDLRGSTPQGVGPVTYALTQASGPATSAVSIVAGVWLIPAGASVTTWSATATQGGVTSPVTTVTVPALPSGSSGGGIRYSYNGTAWV